MTSKVKRMVVATLASTALAVPAAYAGNDTTTCANANTGQSVVNAQANACDAVDVGD